MTSSKPRPIDVGRSKVKLNQPRTKQFGVIGREVNKTTGTRFPFQSENSGVLSRSSVGKKMETVVHFNAIPCKPYKDQRVQRKPYFATVVHANDIVFTTFEGFGTILYVFTCIVKVFVR